MSGKQEKKKKKAKQADIRPSKGHLEGGNPLGRARTRSGYFTLTDHGSSASKPDGEEKHE